MGDRTISVTYEMVDNVTGPLKNLQSETVKTGQSIDAVGPSFQRMAAHSTREFSRMTMEAQAFGRNLQSGNIIGAVIDFGRMASTAFRSMGIEMAIATGGLSVLAAGIAIHLASAKSDAEELDRMRKEMLEQDKIYEDFRIKYIQDKQEKAREQQKLDNKKDHTQLIQDKAKELALFDSFNQEKLNQGKMAQDEEFSGSQYYNKQALAEYEVLMKQRDAINKKWDALLVANDVDTKNKISSINEEPAKKSSTGKKPEYMIDGLPYSEWLKMRQQHFAEIRAGNEWKAKSEKQRLDAEFKYNEDTDKAIIEQDKLVLDHNKKMADEMVGVFTSLGADIGSALAKGGVHEAEKAFLKDTLSFVENIIITHEAAALATAWWNPGVWAQIAVTAGMFEAAKAGVNSFQTSPGQFKTIPGNPNQGVMIMAHGGETIGRNVTNNTTNAPQIHLHIDGGIDTASAQLLVRKLDSLARDGHFNRAFNLRAALAA